MDTDDLPTSTSSGNQMLLSNNSSTDLGSKTISDGSIPTKRASLELMDKTMANVKDKEKDVPVEPPVKKIKIAKEEDKGSHCLADLPNKNVKDGLNNLSSNTDTCMEVCNQNDTGIAGDLNNTANGQSKNATTMSNTQQLIRPIANLTSELTSTDKKTTVSSDIIVEENCDHSLAHTNGVTRSSKPLGIHDLAKSKMTMDCDVLRQLLESTGMCQIEIKNLSEEAAELIMKVEARYNKLRKPVFQRRSNLFKTFPTFWRIAFSGHGFINSVIQEEEKKCLNYMTDCEVDEFEDICLGYKLTFHFAENPYFENSTISKTLKYPSSLLATSESTEIKWKDGYNLMQKYYAKILRRDKQMRKNMPATFFSWFFDNRSGVEDSIAEAIKEDLYPLAMRYYKEFHKKKQFGFDEEEDDDDSHSVILISDDSDPTPDKEGGEVDVCGVVKDDDSSVETIFVRLGRPVRVSRPNVHVEENPPSDKEEDVIALAEMGGDLRDGSPDSEPEYIPHERVEPELVQLDSSQDSVIVEEHFK